MLTTTFRRILIALALGERSLPCLIDIDVGLRSAPGTEPFYLAELKINGHVVSSCAWDLCFATAEEALASLVACVRSNAKAIREEVGL